MKDDNILDLLDEQYLKADNKSELDYWIPLSEMIIESVILRDSLNYSQGDLAVAMNTTQSVISRFENMGRIPSYDFIARMATALGHAPGMTLTGDFMAVVPMEMQNMVAKAALVDNKSTRKFVQELLEDAIKSLEADTYDTNIADFERHLKEYTTISMIYYKGNAICQKQRSELAG